ncbi:hypothetical protein ACHWQZ_G016434 [Mnemiopsis leidyi]
MTVEEQYEHFFALSAMLPKIVHQEFSEQKVSKKYQHNPSGGKKRKLKDTTSEEVEKSNSSNIINSSSGNRNKKRPKVMSVEKVQSLDLSELKDRLHKKIESAKVARNNCDAKLKKRKEMRLMKSSEKKSKTKIVKAVKLETSILDSKKVTQSKDLSCSSSLQFSKFETKTKEDVNLLAAKRKKKKKNLVKMLDEAKKNKKEVSTLQKSTDIKSAALLQDKAWAKAISMAKGEKQKDNPELIVKTIKRKEQSKKKSKKEWTSRIGGQKKAQKEKQKKRQANIEKRIQGKKSRK